jgi:hypothetical protein
MTRAKRKARRNTVGSWREAKVLLERRRKDLKTLTVDLKQVRVIDLVPIDFVSGSRSSAGENQQRDFEDNSFTLRTKT